MLGIGTGWVKVAGALSARVGLPGSVVGRAAVLAVAVVLAGCFWRSYPARVATHADLLVAMARKGADLVAAGRVTAGTLPELVYPLERAQAFAAEARRRSGDAPPPSLAPFEALLASYRRFCDQLDRGRGSGPASAARAALAPALAAVERDGAAVHAALAAT